MMATKSVQPGIPYSPKADVTFVFNHDEGFIIDASKKIEYYMGEETETWIMAAFCEAQQNGGGVTLGTLEDLITYLFNISGVINTYKQEIKNFLDVLYSKDLIDEAKDSAGNYLTTYAVIPPTILWKQLVYTTPTQDENAMDGRKWKKPKLKGGGSWALPGALPVVRCCG